MTDSADRLQETSERFVEGQYATRSDYLIYLMAVATYDWAAQFTAGRDVLDFGCGSGWGAARLASTSRRVLGVDVDAEAIAYAQSRYQAANLEFALLDGQSYRETFDSIVSIQVIEHVPDADAYLALAARALRRGGEFLLATPNRATRLFPFQRPWNPWHVSEWDRRGLERLLGRHFAEVQIFDMTGDIDWEISRTRRMRWIALPLTLPFIPSTVRHRSLRAISTLRQRRSRWKGEASLSVEIVPEGQPSVNLLARARKA